MIKKLFKLLVRTKVYVSRSMGYINMLNSAMILFLLLSGLEKYGIDLNIEKYYFLIMGLSIFCLVLWGIIEDRLGLWEYEQSVSQDRSPFNYKMKEQLSYIQKILMELKTK